MKITPDMIFIAVVYLIGFYVIMTRLLRRGNYGKRIKVMLHNAYNKLNELYQNYRTRDYYKGKKAAGTISKKP